MWALNRTVDDEKSDVVISTVHKAKGREWNKHGGGEAFAVENSMVVIGWDELPDVSAISSRDELQKLMNQAYPEENITTTRIWTGEVWAFKERMQKGDWIALPLKSRAAVAIGKIEGPYKFSANAPDGAKHQRRVKWLRTDLPRAEIDQDLLYSLGSSLTVFQVKRNNAEERITALVEGRRPNTPSPASSETEVPIETEGSIDLEQLATDQIAGFIARKFRGHEFARLVSSVLVAEGYQVQVSPPGADGGVDIIAGTGPMGFDAPRIAVQVKSGDTPVDVTVIRELQGVMPRFGADNGLVVSWGGFKDSVPRETRQLFFKIRLWDSNALVAALQRVYQKLPADIQAELPLKQIWAMALEEFF